VNLLSWAYVVVATSDRFQALLGAIRLLGSLDDLHHVSLSIKSG